MSYFLKEFEIDTVVVDLGSNQNVAIIATNRPQDCIEVIGISSDSDPRMLLNFNYAQDFVGDIMLLNHLNWYLFMEKITPSPYLAF